MKKVEDPVGQTNSAAGRTLLQILWEELDRVMDVIRSEGKPAGSKPEDHKAWGERRGQAQGVAYAIAVITNPYAPSLPAVRKVAMERADARWAE